MKKEVAEILFDLMQGACVECSMRDEYSGRGMYGETTHAISGDFSDGDVAVAVASAYDLGYIEGTDIVPEDFSYRSDNMGLGIVIY